MRTLQLRDDPIGRKATPLLVFGVCGRTGSGASFVASALNEELRAFGYDVKVIKIAQEFLDNLDAVKSLLSDTTQLFEDNESVFTEFLTRYHLKQSDLSEKASRILRLQRRGDELRKSKGMNYLAALCIDQISKNIQENKLFSVNISKRQAYILDSLKNPSEVDLLRTVFHDGFCMIGAVADDTVRKRRLEDQKGIKGYVFDAISEIDAGDTQENHGQKATETILQSDYFFENNFDKPGKIKTECARLLNLLFQSEIETPRRDEYGMHIAFMAADRSACLSRQVGSAIISVTDTVLATGHNDVPQYGGGLYTTESFEDNRCFAKSLKCHNDEEKELLASQIIQVFKSKQLQIDEAVFLQMKEILLKETRLKLLIEFTRAVHAEMDAIISVARDAKPGLVGSTMYVTTYPCHNCAKHIIDSGIKRVVFLEPYSKSLAQKLHSDAINNPLEMPSESKVTFSNYGGVSPERYPFWFSTHGERKKAGRMIRKSTEKVNMLPLCAQEIEYLESTLSQFQKWFGGASSAVAGTVPTPLVPEPEPVDFEGTAAEPPVVQLPLIKKGEDSGCP